MNESQLSKVSAVAMPFTKGAVIGLAIIALAIAGVNKTAVNSKVRMTPKNPVNSLSFSAGYSSNASNMNNFKKTVNARLASLKVKPQPKVSFTAFKSAVKKQQLPLTKYSK